jgi:HEAT repeat protein
MIRYLVRAGRIFVAAMVVAMIAAGAASPQNGKPDSESLPDVSQLVKQLKSLDLQEREHAARELEKVKPLPPQAIDALVGMVGTVPWNEAQHAINALSTAGPRAIPPLAALAESGNEMAVLTLGRMAFSEPAAWPVLVGLFKSDFSGIRSAAASGLAIAGSPVVPLLVKALADDDPRMRAGAAETLVHMRLRPTNEVGVRYAKPEDLAPAVPLLDKSLSDPDSEVRDNAALALAYADPSDKRAAQILVQMLDRGASFEVIAALQNMGSNSKIAVPALERVLAGSHYWLMCVSAAQALTKIDGSDACAALAQAIVGSENDLARGWVTDAADSINRVREGAANAIVEISPVCPQTIPTLVATLGKPWSATSALTKLGGPAVPDLVHASGSKDPKVREDAVRTLAAIRPLAPAAVHALTLALNDGKLDLDSRQAIVTALADVKPPTSGAVDGLMFALKDQSNIIRSTAAKALQDLGGDAGQAAQAELKREQLVEAQASKPDTRLYSREELIAAIHDPDREYPLSLEYLVPILSVPASVEEAPFVITVHAAKDNFERLTFWKKTGADRYQKLNVVDSDPDNQEHFHAPITFHATVQVNTAGGRQVEERDFFVNVPKEWWRGGGDQIFAVDSDGLHSVEIESPDEQISDPKKIPAKYSAASRVPQLGSYHQLEWSFAVFNDDDAMCCPSGGEVDGTYKVVKDDTKSPPTWKMVVDTAKWERPERTKVADVSQLLRDLNSSDSQRRQDATQKLLNPEPLTPQAIQALAEAAKKPNPPGSEGQPTCEIAIQSLARAADSDPMVLPILIDALKGCSSPEPAARALARIGGSVPLLVKALEDKDPCARAGAAEALGLMVMPMAMGQRYFIPEEPFGISVRATASAAALAPAVPALTELLQDSHSNIRNQAAITLALLSPNDKRAVPILVQLLQGADYSLREVALAALDGMGESAKDAVPAVEYILATDRNPHTAGRAAHVLGSIAGASACAPLNHAITDSKNSFVRECAVIAIGRLWPACPQTIPTLIGTFGGDDQVAFYAARELGHIGKPATPALTAALGGSDPKTRLAAAQAFANMKATLTPEAVDALTTALGDKDSELKSTAARALDKAGGAPEQAARAEEKREEKADEAANPTPQEPPVPQFSKEQIIAQVPGDANHKYPLTLALFAPISGYVVTLHTGKDRFERLVFWQVTDDKYQKVVAMESNLDSEEHFQVPISFDSTIGPPPPEGFVDVPILGRRGVADRVLHVDDEGQWQPVEIESPEDWYEDKLGPSETVRRAGRNFLSDGSLEFAFSIWNSNDPDCCPTAGEVTGTYKIVRAEPSIVEAPGFSLTQTIAVAGNRVAQAQGSQPRVGVTFGAGPVMAGSAVVVQPQSPPAAAAAGSYGGGTYISSGGNEQNSVTWKMIVDTAKRQPADAKTVQEILQ